MPVNRRCSNPLKLLQQIHTKLERDGLLLLALVLPYSPFIDDPSNVSCWSLEPS